MGNLTSQKLVEIRGDLENLLQGFGKKHSLAFTVGGIRYNSTSFRTTLSAISLDKNQTSEEALEAPYKEDLRTFGEDFGLSLSDYGKVFVSGSGRRFKFLGVSIRKRRYPLVGKEVGTGKIYFFTEKSSKSIKSGKKQ